MSLIGATTTSTGLRVQAEVNRGSYPKGVEVTDEDMEKLRIKKANFHGEWNYSIKPIKP